MSKPPDKNILLIQDNKKAFHDFEIFERFEAGLQLTGSEVKSLRNKSVQLKDAYVAFRGKEAFLQNAHISEYKASSYNNHSPERVRKLLLNENELDEISRALQERGLTCVPLKIYFKKGWAKIEIGLARGKKLHDKREAIKTKDINNRLRDVMKKSR